jgi:anti-sigma-K factor RskA
MAADTEFTAIVHAWEYRLGVLNQMVGSAEPRPVVWENIRAAIGRSWPEAGLEWPETPEPPSAVSVEAEAIPAGDISGAERSNVIQLSGLVQRWRNLASFATAAAAVLIAMLALQVYQPDLLPDGIRPKPRTQVVEVKKPTPSTQPSAQYVALLQRDGGAPAFILTVDAATKTFTVRKIGADAEPGKSFELWLISDKLPQPRSLGVIGASEFTTRPVLSSYDTNTINTATYAVTVEQAGGSPDGKPSSAPIFTGKLIETVPPTAPR